jgi:hypothetical protein
MTGFAKGHEVLRVTAAAFRERKNVVNFLGRRQFALLLAFLTERVRLDVAVTDTLPRTAVSFVGSRVALVLVVAFVHDLLMLGTVLLTHGKPTAAGVGAWALGFVWHEFTSSRA